MEGHVWVQEEREREKEGKIKVQDRQQLVAYARAACRMPVGAALSSADGNGWPSCTQQAVAECPALLNWLWPSPSSLQQAITSS